jgi:DNA adenine methylase
LLSNSDPKNTVPDDNFFDELYSGYKIERVSANRAINSNPEKRGPITELLISNY